MKYTFVGDLHGKWEVAEEALSLGNKTIFVGDYVDSFDRSADDQEKTLNIVLDAIEKGHHGLYGNHELSYLFPWPHRCSGYNNNTARVIKNNEKKMLSQLKAALAIGNEWIVTHAGITEQIFIYYKAINNLDLEKSIEKDFRKLDTPVHWIGIARGGNNYCGGIFWCDYDKEFVPVKGLNQVFGHTRQIQMRELKFPSKNYCIDYFDHNKDDFLVLDI